VSRSTSTKRRHGHGLVDHDRGVCIPSGRKLRFRSRKLALTSLNGFKAHHPDKDHLRVYHCPVCADWHFTSSPQRTG
jgi:hypothetical protein